MAIKWVVVLGGGPIGLMSAIEASKYFKEVFIIEKRTEYTRSNVPVLQDAVKQHLKDLKLEKQLGWKENNEPSLAFSQIEEALWDKAQSKGVKMKRGFVVTDVVGSDKKPNGMFKTMTLTICPWDHKTRSADTTKPISMRADLLVIATGGGAQGDGITSKLGFVWEELKAKNYAAYGIFEPGAVYSYGGNNNNAKAPVFNSELKKALYEPVKAIVPGASGTGKTSITTKEHNYLLVTLAGITRADFKELQANNTKLQKLLMAVGKTIEGTVLSELKTDVDRNVALFKISVKRAQQFYSPEYPAVLIGDAAVTPHPETGSGMVTGFKGVEELQKLFKALAGTNRAEDNKAHFLSFDKSYELHVASKALKGTWTILDNLQKMLGQFKADIGGALRRSGHPGYISVAKSLEMFADGLIQDLKAEKAEAEALHEVLEGKSPVNLDPRSNVSRLWRTIGQTYKDIKEFTGDLTLLDERLSEMELKVNAATK